ncbi:MAG: response regulator [Chloroflexi bacterium]|nr:response regulator [Chloroflexota bacterium]MBU1748074.1 response regulator [Chloroflexota bacterium]
MVREENAAGVSGTVLLVEGDPAYQVVIQMALFQAGHTVQLAVTLEEMVIRLSAPRLPHLVILDWSLPGGETAREALRWIRSHRDPRIQSLPVLVLTAVRRAVSVHHQALDAGATECLTKVTPLGRVVDHVTDLIRARRASPSPLTIGSGGCPLQLAGHHVIRVDRGTQAMLTPNQADLLRLLLERPGEVVPRGELESRLLPVSTARHTLLRRRVHDLNQRLKHVGAVARARRGVGYYLDWV